MNEVLKFLVEYREAIFIIILSIFLGIEVISHVPSVLHTPLMSGANAIHGWSSSAQSLSWDMPATSCQ